MQIATDCYLTQIATDCYLTQSANDCYLTQIANDCYLTQSANDCRSHFWKKMTVISFANAAVDPEILTGTLRHLRWVA